MLLHSLVKVVPLLIFGKRIIPGLKITYYLEYSKNRPHITNFLKFFWHKSLFLLEEQLWQYFPLHCRLLEGKVLLDPLMSCILNVQNRVLNIIVSQNKMFKDRN